MKKFKKQYSTFNDDNNKNDMEKKKQYKELYKYVKEYDRAKKEYGTKKNINEY